MMNEHCDHGNVPAWFAVLSVLPMKYNNRGVDSAKCPGRNVSGLYPESRQDTMAPTDVIVVTTRPNSSTCVIL
jgi:hypothetical protein